MRKAISDLSKKPDQPIKQSIKYIFISSLGTGRVFALVRAYEQKNKNVAHRAKKKK